MPLFTYSRQASQKKATDSFNYNKVVLALNLQLWLSKDMLFCVLFFHIALSCSIHHKLILIGTV